jgi:protocatechuate 3,4-dioxygenase beta subunit
MDAYNDRLQQELDSIEVWQAACHGYYRHPVSGRIVTQWPGTMAAYRERTTQPDAGAYEEHPLVP